MNVINLQCADETISVSTQIARMSETIASILDNRAKEDQQKPVPLESVSSSILKMIIKWCEYHLNDPKENLALDERNLSEWDKKFLDVDQSTLFELIIATNYLDVKSLLDMSCMKVANMIRGKSAEEVRKMFNIKNDFTAVEEAEVKKESDWLQR
ncbi:S-phase kinase-associated protein 1-like protein [Dinothrombium tinctorium]|uniref:S-phase kinase-associated protein 1-like protein n=1 Tax=Dinothrombium tinctorium TaxID=1965070 RepID=A0A3S3P8F6_9ACAR|nr:S-phase kinase-associated protein 1-like protein [Dinothrombium tinctorium]RWS07477.1 S-phase kinase-associated protein 1-like protein [Dinothrombium tinctorium]RWS07478.1 S-phase kinase-associated protein 1-like protein [Dinothrombium tinctorium]